MSGDMNIANLPIEMFVEILKYIDGCDLGRCRRVCKEWKECVDDTDLLWQKMCQKEFKSSSLIAKRKADSACRWYHIYKNLKQWTNLSRYDITVKEFYKFSLHDKSHVIDIDYGILPLKDSKGIVMFDISTLTYVPVALQQRNCYKIANNNHVTVILIKTGILVQRTVDSPTFVTEEFFKADNFVLNNDTLYFYHHKDVFKCNLMSQDLASKLLAHCDYAIKEMQCSEGVINIFTDCGKIVNINKDRSVTVKPINCPGAWIRLTKHICAVDSNNYVCYSRNLIKIETDQYKHLCLEFPPITALFFYVDILLFGTCTGEILLYRLSNQKKTKHPKFETLAILPAGKIAVQLDVCETKMGPIIVASTFFELYLLQIPFFPHEQKVKPTFTEQKFQMFKRFLKLKERLTSYCN